MSSIQPDHQPDDAHYTAILQELIDRGMDLARLVHEQAKTRTNTDETTDPTPDPTIAFDRIARTIRRTIALARHIAAGTPTHKPGPALARAKIIRDVEDAIHRRTVQATPEGRKHTDTQSLYAELNERLDDPALAEDLATRPIEDIIDEIARDLGVPRTSKAVIWKRRTPAEVQTLRKRAAPPPPPPKEEDQGNGPGDLPPLPPAAERQGEGPCFLPPLPPAGEGRGEGFSLPSPSPPGRAPG